MTWQGRVVGSRSAPRQQPWPGLASAHPSHNLIISVLPCTKPDPVPTLRIEETRTGALGLIQQLEKDIAALTKQLKEVAVTRQQG